MCHLYSLVFKLQLASARFSFVHFAGAILINNARVVKSEVFVYNLGTMFYIDQVLFAEGGLPPRDHQGSTPTGPFHVTTEIPEEVETIPIELNKDVDGTSLQDDDSAREPTTTTPELLAKALSEDDP